MANLQVILSEDISNLGEAGDVPRVGGDTTRPSFTADDVVTGHNGDSGNNGRDQYPSLSHGNSIPTGYGRSSERELGFCPMFGTNSTQPDR